MTPTGKKPRRRKTRREKPRIPPDPGNGPGAAALVWPGKPDTLKDAVASPLENAGLLKPHALYAPNPDQPQKRTDGPDVEPWGRLIFGDNIRAMAALRTQLEGRVDLIYMDPPYGTGRARKTTKGPDGVRSPDPEAGFSDLAASDPEYLQHLYTVLILARGLLGRTGQIFVHVDHRAGHFVRMMMDELFGEQALRNEIVWHYESGGRARKTYARKADVLLWYSVSSRYVFKPDLIGSPRNVCRKCGRELDHWNHMKRHRDSSGRTYRTISSAGKTYRYYDDEQIPPSNVWLDIPHIHQKDPQRTGYPAQKPEPLLERILTAHSRPGDLVCDFYCGSGTTLVSAEKLGRRWIGCDSNPLAVHLSRQRLLALSPAGPRPFTIEHLAPPKATPAPRPADPETRRAGGPELVSVLLSKGTRGTAVRMGNRRARLDFWAVQWHASADGLFRPEWWSVRSHEKPVSELSPAVSNETLDTKTVRVLMGDETGVETFVDLECRL